MHFTRGPGSSVHTVHGHFNGRHQHHVSDSCRHQVSGITSLTSKYSISLIFFKNIFHAFRLPIVQNSGFVYMTCTLSLLNLPRWECPSEVDLFSMGHEARTLEWQLRVRNIQGSMIIVSIVQMLLGYSGEYCKFSFLYSMCALYLKKKKGLIFWNSHKSWFMYPFLSWNIKSDTIRRRRRRMNYGTKPSYVYDRLGVNGYVDIISTN